MKMFDRRYIMERAWDIHNVDNIQMSDALQTAWNEVRSAKYAFNMTDERRKAIETVIERVDAGLKKNGNIHQAHKLAILKSALRIKLENGIAMMFGQQVGLCKWALRNA